MVFQFTSWHLTLALKGQIKVLWFHLVCIIDNVLLTAKLSGREASCFYFGMNLPKDGTNQLPKAGFDWIALKVILQGRKGLNLPLFSNFDIYCPIYSKSVY